MKLYQNQFFSGERSLFKTSEASLKNVTFGKGESPLKESHNLELNSCIFQWKYPLWYCSDIKVDNSIFETMARSGIWYTNKIYIKNSTCQSPKLFRHCHNVELNSVYFSDASETLWNCNDIKIQNVQASGNYFGLNSKNITLDHFQLVGNYAFDGATNIEAHNSTFVSKDAFWNCKNVKLYDCMLNGEYLGWNTNNLELINCTIESNQGLCYIDNLKMKNCKLLNTDLAFEYCTNINAHINSNILSVKNPISGQIIANHIDNIIQNDPKIDLSKIKIIQNDEK